MSVKFKVQCKGCTQSFMVDVEIPAETRGRLRFDLKNQLAASCPTCGRDVILPAGTYDVADGKAEIAKRGKARQ